MISLAILIWIIGSIGACYMADFIRGFIEYDKKIRKADAKRRAAGASPAAR